MFWEEDTKAYYRTLTTYGKASSLKIGAFLGGTPILGPQGPKMGDPPKSAPIDY